MSVRTLFTISLLLGIGIGSAITWVNFGQAGALLGPAPAELPVAAVDGLPKLAVDATVHDFGTIDRETTARHSFRVTNAGQGVLRLKAGKTTCSACTIAALDKNELGPGESAEILIEYSPAQFAKDFRQTATVLSNDPEHSRLELTVTGKLSSKLRAVPYQFEFGNVPAGESATLEMQLLYMIKGKLEVTDKAFEAGAAAGSFSLEVRPLPPEDFDDPQANSGKLLVLSLKPGLPLGPFSQTIRLTLDPGNGGDTFEQKIAATGTIVSDLSVVGAGWLPDASVLRFGTVSREKGATRTLRVLVRGESRKAVEIEPIKVDPPELKVTVGEAKPLNDTVEQIPLEIEIPADLQPMVRLGTQQGPYGEVVLGIKNHPDVKELKLRLQFAIE